MPRNFATFGPSELQPPFTGFSKKSVKLFFLYLQHRAGVSLYTSFFNFAETCGFINQSLSLFLWQLFKVSLKKLLLLPKLRSHFAEFLQHNSLKRLSLLNLFTCVGLKYGFIFFYKAISWTYVNHLYLNQKI